MRLGRGGVALIAVLAVGCSTATPTVAPTSPEAPPSTSPRLDASGTLPTPGFPPPSPSDEPAGPTSTDLILAAHERGELSDEDAAVYRVFAAFGDSRLPAEFRSESAGWEDHLATRDAAGLWDQLSAEQREAIAPYFIPPIYAGSWAGPAAEAGAGLTAGLGLAGAPVTAAVDPKDCASEQLRDQFYVNVPAAGGKVRIWWRNGIETSARAGTVASMLAAEIDTNIWPKLTALMGREPLSDEGVGCFNGEDGALDIYITDRTLPGYAKALTIAYPGACTGTPAFIIFDQPRDGRDYGTIDPAKLHVWEYAHEIFHAFQFAYAYGGPCSAFADMDEGTAMWAAEYVYPTEQFEWNWSYGSWFRWNYVWLYGHSSGAYGSWPLFASITHRHGVERMRMLYEATEQVSGGYDAIEIIAPGGIEAYWPQFVRDLWDDHEEHNVWRDWDPGNWSSEGYDPSQGQVFDVVRPGGGGILTLEAGTWRVAPWSENPCGLLSPTTVFAAYETVGQWTCPLAPNESPPATATYERDVTVYSLGRGEHEYWFADEDWPRYIKIKAPGLGSEDEHLSVQGFYQLRDGTWAGPLDWKGEDEIEFCRDQDDQDITRVAILYGNSEVPTGYASPDIQGTYTVEVRETCPRTLQVSIRLTVSSSGQTYEDWTITGTLEPFDPDKTYPADAPIDFIDVGDLVGSGTYVGSGLVEILGCNEAVTGPGSGDVWLLGWIEQEGWPGLPPGPAILIQALGDMFDTPHPPWPSAAAPMDGTTWTWESVEDMGDGCGNPIFTTTTVTATPGTGPE